MSYLVIARKFRPSSFSSVTGQEHVTRTLINAIRRNKVAHAYVFAGPRGVGKTSVARIFSKALNCQNQKDGEACLECAVCKEIAGGASLAVREIDGASHNSVDNVRDLIESFRSVPPPGYRHKIYIIDEVHMLSTSAFNALLKSLEEPPPNTIFILATTEPHKIPETVLSRCQRHDFRALTHEQVVSRLKEIATQEGLEVEPDVFALIARLSDGSMRDSQSLLERVQAFCSGKITAQEASQALGVVGRSALFALSSAIFSRDAAKSLRELSGAFSSGVDPTLFIKEFAAHWRELLFSKFAQDSELAPLGINGDLLLQYRSHVGAVSEHDLQDLAYLARDGADNALRSSFPKYALEALVVRLSTRQKVAEIAELIGKIQSGSKGNPKETERAQSNVKRVSAPPSHEHSRTEPSLIGALDWGQFCTFATKNGSKIFVEHVRRLVPEKFVKGILVIRGPGFTLAYLREKENLAKLVSALCAFSNHEPWHVQLLDGEGPGATQGVSVREKEQLAADEERVSLEKKVAEHPKIKSLQRLFPGSTIESITVKEE